MKLSDLTKNTKMSLLDKSDLHNLEEMCDILIKISTNTASCLNMF